MILVVELGVDTAEVPTTGRVCAGGLGLGRDLGESGEVGEVIDYGLEGEMRGDELGEEGEVRGAEVDVEGGGGCAPDIELEGLPLAQRHDVLDKGRPRSCGPEEEEIVDGGPHSRRSRASDRL